MRIATPRMTCTLQCMSCSAPRSVSPSRTSPFPMPLVIGSRLRQACRVWSCAGGSCCDALNRRCSRRGTRPACRPLPVVRRGKSVRRGRRRRGCLRTCGSGAVRSRRGSGRPAGPPAVDPGRQTQDAHLYALLCCRGSGLTPACIRDDVWGCVVVMRGAGGSYKPVTGRSHTGEKRISMHPRKPGATSQPSHRLTTDSPHN